MDIWTRATDVGSDIAGWLIVVAGAIWLLLAVVTLIAYTSVILAERIAEARGVLGDIRAWNRYGRPTAEQAAAWEDEMEAATARMQLRTRDEKREATEAGKV